MVTRKPAKKQSKKPSSPDWVERRAKLQKVKPDYSKDPTVLANIKKANDAAKTQTKTKKPAPNLESDIAAKIKQGLANFWKTPGASQGLGTMLDLMKKKKK